MKTTSVTVVLLLFVPGAFAGGIELNKGAVAAYPPGAGGVAAIAGAPGCVAGYPPLYVTARNRNGGAAVNARVAPDGSFSVRIPAVPGDAVRLVFYSGSGKDKDMTVRVPGDGVASGAGAPGGERAEVNVDLGPFAQFGAPEVVQVKPDGRGGTRVHVGRRPPAPAPPTVPRGTASPAPSATPAATPSDG